jgi:putative hydrolase of HD superfamily
MSRDAELLYEIGTLRFLKRTWSQFLNPNFANIAEHSYRVTWIALMLARRSGSIDEVKLLKMALVHDLPEARTGDVHYVSRMYTERHEDKAMREAVADSGLDGLVALWKEYEKRACLEAKLVKDADTLDVELEIEEQLATGFQWAGVIKKKRQEAVYPLLLTEAARDLWQEIHATAPYDWHEKARNRINSGDWQINPEG